MNKKRVTILLGIVLLLTGCVKYDLNMGVNTDKSFTLTIIDAIQNEYAGTSNGETNFEEYEKLGYDVEIYSDKTHTGLKLTKKFTSIDDLSSSDCPPFELTSLLELKTTDFNLFKSHKTGTITTYTANFTYDLTVEESKETENVDYSEYSDTMIFIYTISLPENANIISDNADEKTNNGYTLTWNMKYGELKNINFSFSMDDNNLKEVENNGIDNNDKNNTTNDNQTNNDNQDENINVEENESEINNDKQYVKSDKNTFGSIIGVLLASVLILGIVVYKIKLKKDSITPTSAMNHRSPPKR